MDRRITAGEVWPAGWEELLGTGPIGIGLDPATTAKKKSNPTAIAVTERRGDTFIVRAVVRFKTDNPNVTRAVLREALVRSTGHRARKLCVLATSERFFAADLARELSGVLPVELVIESESILYRGERMMVKTYLGNLVVNSMSDGKLWVPSATWLRDDIRQTRREKGGFEAEVDKAGNHADCFCAIGASLKALVSIGERVEAYPVLAGPLGRVSDDDAAWAKKREGWTSLDGSGEESKLYV